MPWYKFLQPIREGWADTEPDHWNMQMWRPDPEGWPSDQVDVPISENGAYFECDLGYIEDQCAEYLGEDLGLAPQAIPQYDMNLCITNNLSQCSQVLTGELPYENGWIQLQACDEGGIACSSWSDASIVPEPGTELGLLICVGFLAWLAIWRRTAIGKRWPKR